MTNRADALELEVGNIGPIVEARVDLRPLTVFVGPSNTGKSYLAMLVYALHRFFWGSSDVRFWGRPRLQLYRSSRRKWRLFSESAITDLLNWAQQFSQKTETEKESGKFEEVLPENIASLIRPLLEPTDDSANMIEIEIARCFGLQAVSELIRRPGTGKAQIVLRRYAEKNRKDENPFIHTFDIPQKGDSHFSVSIPSDKPLQPVRNIERLIWRFQREGRSDDHEERKFLATGLINELADVVFPHVVGPIISPAYYLPADRTGIMHAHRVVVSALVERAATAGIRPAAPMPMLSGVLADFLEQLIALGDIPSSIHTSKRRKDSETLARRLEQTLLGGTVHYEGSGRRGTSYPSVFYQPQGWKEPLALMRASSMVSELAPVVLYLRHIVQPCEVLIIEEPESHLHPSMQVELTRVLAAAVRQGVGIIITIHSEWILEELANLVQLSTLPDTQRKKLDPHDTALAPHQVGAWLFQSKQRPKGSVVQEISLDEASGTYPAGYEDVAAALHNRGADIASYLEEDQ